MSMPGLGCEAEDARASAALDSPARARCRKRAVAMTNSRAFGMAELLDTSSIDSL